MNIYFYRSTSADGNVKVSQLEGLKTLKTRTRSSPDMIFDAPSLTSSDAGSMLSDSDNDSEDASTKRSSIFSAFSSSWSGKASSIQKEERPGGVVPMVPKSELTRSISLASAVSSASDESSGSNSSGGIACSYNYELCTCRTPAKLDNGSRAEDPSIFSDRLVSATPSPTKGDDAQRKKKTKRRLPSSQEEDKIVSIMILLKQIDEKNYSTQFTDSKTLDADQIEMLRRIEKCLLVRSVIRPHTISCTTHLIVCLVHTYR